MKTSKNKRDNVVIRKGPYPDELFSSKAWRFFWIGKAPRTRDAITEYLSKYRTKEEMPQWHVSMKHGITGPTIIRNIRALKKAGIIPNKAHLIKKTTGEEAARQYKTLLSENPSIRRRFYDKQRALGYVLCTECSHLVSKWEGGCMLNLQKKIYISNWRKCKNFVLKEDVE